MATQAYPYPVEDTQTVISELNELKKVFYKQKLSQNDFSSEFTQNN